MKTMDVTEAAHDFSQVTKLLESGETVLLCQNDRPLAEIRPVESSPQSGRRPVALGAGLIEVPDDFNEPDPVLDNLFYGYGSPEP